jgi:hypothetical protein
MAQGVIALQTCIGLASLLALAACWRTYRLDAFRHKLFFLRDELFNLCRSGELPFDDRANRKLRWALDGTIRFAHKLTLIRLILTMLGQRFRPELRLKGIDWHSVTAHLPEHVKEKVDGIRAKMAMLVIWHIISGSPITLILLVLVILGWTIKNGIFALVRGSAAIMLRQISDTPTVAEAVGAMEVQASDGKWDDSGLAYQI